MVVLLATIRDIEDIFFNDTATPEKIAQEAERLRMELKGRRAAFAVGSAHLKSFREA